MERGRLDLTELEKILKENNAIPQSGYGEVNLNVKFNNNKIVHLEVIEKKTSIKLKENTHEKSK